MRPMASPGPTFAIPADPRKADALAGELGELATSVEWRRAALVYARVRVQDGQGRPTAEMAKSGLLSPAQYARRGIHGLRSKTTVISYWRAWDNACAEGLAVPVSLGDEVELPSAEWADFYHPVDHSTPPYYVPPQWSMAEPVPTHDVSDDDAHETWEERNRRDGLGLGSCPPVASDVDQPEGGPLGPSVVDPRRPRRRPKPLSDRTRSLAKISHHSAERDLLIAVQYAEELPIADAVERSARIRQRLNEFECAFAEAEAGAS